MARPAGDVGDPQFEQGRLGVVGLETFGNQVVKRVADERLNEVIWRVVGAGGGAVVSLAKAEVQLVAFARELRLVLEQTLIDRAELLDVEGRVVYPDELTAVRVPVEAEGAQAAEEHVVAEGAAGERADGRGREQIASQGRDAELGAGAVCFEQAETGLQRKPEILAARVGEVALLREAAQAGHAVELAVNIALHPGCVRREDQVPLFDHHEEEQAVDETQELLVVVTGREIAVDNGRAETVVVGVREETVAEVKNRALNRMAQPRADAGARVERVLVVLLDQARGRRVVRQRQAGGVKQPVEDSEVGKEAVGEDAVEVELKVALLDQP